jgi:hypothetical protein
MTETEPWASEHSTFERVADGVLVALLGGMIRMSEMAGLQTRDSDR